ncbi:MAG: UDP-N-acetylmuramoyl-tripeptide--D-alanyl-D-alanine ligase [Patescibacteria group bacterium]|nr:UDP-N-acetylmuramoyl-tripeptide--D-alanyl-D-alanine ligase [Patescibacteria group bacterium]
MLIRFFILPLFLFFFCWRWLYWLALVQQKEYRLDRLLIFLRTKQGQQALTYFFPQFKNFSFTKIKRPVRTPRMISLILLSLVLSAGWIAYLNELNATIFILGLVAWTMLLPLIIYFTVLPSKMVFELASWYYQQIAIKKLKKIRPTIIGITGSYGKTTTKVILAHILSKHFSVFATKKSFNTRYSLPKNIARNYKGEKIIILEFAAYKPGEIKFLTNFFPPNFSIITGLTQQHLALFGSEKNIIKAKAELVAAQDQKQPVFINGIDPGTKQIAEKGEAKKIIDYSGLQSKVKIAQTKLNKLGQLSFVWKKQKIKTYLIGKQYLQAIKATISVAQFLQVSEEKIRQGISNFEPPDYFIQSQLLESGLRVIDDGCTSNPQGFRAMISLLADLKADYEWVGLLTAGLVDLGDESEQIHHDLAQQAGKVFDEVWYVGWPGLTQFKKVFSEEKRFFYEGIDEIMSRIEQLPENGILLIEGRVPQVIRKYLAV